MEERWTVLRVLQWTAEYFGRKGIEQPRAGAEVLLAHVLGMERIQLYLNFDRPLAQDELASYRELIRRRAAREPTQYITGRQEFWSLEFSVTPDVLIPRPETELLVEKALELVRDSSKRVLDLGTGSGAIAIALAHACKTVQVVATDYSWAALQVARGNATRHHVNERIALVASDLFDGFSSSGPLFDVIISNPPYIGEEEYRHLAPEINCYEPRTALLAGPLGLAFIRRIIGEAPAYLKRGGSLLVEIGAGQAEILYPELSEEPLGDHFEFFPDYSGIQRILHLRRTPDKNYSSGR
jgi:release factor glutamine methyltransferase